MVLILEDLEEDNWIQCDSCGNICKYPSFDLDLQLDECCLCSGIDGYCSACYERKPRKKDKEKR